MLTRHIRKNLQVTPGPFPDFLGGAWGQGYTAAQTLIRLMSQESAKPQQQSSVRGWCLQLRAGGCLVVVACWSVAQTVFPRRS